MKRSGTSSGSAVPLPTGSIGENCRLRYRILRVYNKDFGLLAGSKFRSLP
jgi:hypothetical protein